VKATAQHNNQSERAVQALGMFAEDLAVKEQTKISSTNPMAKLITTEPKNSKDQRKSPK
jgi:hypothetical protein